MRKVRWGVLSTALIGTEKVIPAMQRGQYCDVVAIASRSLEKAQVTAESLGIPKAHGSYEALLAAQDIDRTQIQETMRTDFTSNPLFTDEAEVLAGFVTTEGVQVRQSDPQAAFIMVSDYGIDIYSNVIFTTEDLIASQPDMVRAFLQATLKGTQWAVEQPEEAVDGFLETYGQPYVEDREVHLRGMQLSIPLLVPAGAQPGTMKADDWTFTHETLLDLIEHTSQVVERILGTRVVGLIRRQKCADARERVVRSGVDRTIGTQHAQLR